jgi:hypothetical protein
VIFKFKRKKNLDTILNVLQTIETDLEEYCVNTIKQADAKKNEADKLLFEVQELDSQVKYATSVRRNVHSLLNKEDNQGEL